MSHGEDLAQMASKLPVDDSVRKAAQTRCAAVLQVASEQTLKDRWSDKAVRDFTVNDAMDILLDTNIGRFLIVVRRA